EPAAGGAAPGRRRRRHRRHRRRPRLSGRLDQADPRPRERAHPCRAARRRPASRRRRGDPARLRQGRPPRHGGPVMTMVAAADPIRPGRGGFFGALSDVLWRNPRLTLFLMLTPPLLWLGIIYLGSLFALLLQSFFSIDEYSGL